MNKPVNSVSETSSNGSSGQYEADRDVDDRLLEAEQDVRLRLAGMALDLEAANAVSNIYRAAASVRRRAEGGVLSPHNLSWGGLTILWVLWIWGEQSTAKLAEECDLSKGTLTGMVGTLESQNLVVRRKLDSDRRRVMVELTDDGRDLIADLFPRFNAFEVDVLDGLSGEERVELARLLRVVIRNTERMGDG